MKWWFAYKDAILPYIWLYGIALGISGAIFLWLPKLRRHFIMVVLLLIANQVLDTNAYLFSKETPPASWVVIGHFLFFLGAVHYCILAARGVYEYFRPQPRRRSTLLNSLLYGTVMITAAMVYLEVTEGNINFGLGVASVAAVVGFALQETLANLFAGLTLEADPPFRVGDWIQGEGFTGEVIDITWRATRLRTYECDTLIIPNRSLANAMIVNWSAPIPNHGVHLTIGTSYGDAPGQVKAAIQAVLRDSEGVLQEPPPEIYTENYGDFAITYNVLFFIVEYRDQLRIKDRIMSRIWYQFRRDGIRIPFPIRDVNLHMHSPRERQAEATREHDRKLELLGRLPLFSDLPADDLQYLATEAHFHRYWPGETIIYQGDTPDFLSILVEGQARVLVRAGDGEGSGRRAALPDERPANVDPYAPTVATRAVTAPPSPRVEIENGYAEVSQLNPGEFFGEISVLLGNPATATVRSAGEVLLLVVERAAFVKVLERHPAFQESICSIISQRVNDLNLISKLAEDIKEDSPKEPRTLIHRLRKFLRLRGDRNGA